MDKAISASYAQKVNTTLDSDKDSLFDQTLNRLLQPSF